MATDYFQFTRILNKNSKEQHFLMYQQKTAQFISRSIAFAKKHLRFFVIKEVMDSKVDQGRQLCDWFRSKLKFTEI